MVSRPRRARSAQTSRLLPLALEPALAAAGRGLRWWVFAVLLQLWARRRWVCGTVAFMRPGGGCEMGGVRRGMRG
jgi:hypothetical protein